MPNSNNEINITGEEMLKELIIKNRSYRRFYERFELSERTITNLIDNARLSSSAANLQPLRYIVVNEKSANELVLSALRWAGYLSDWEGPVEGEKPSAYIVMLGDRDYPKYHQFDGGIAAQSILLSATEQSLGGCIFASIERDKLQQDLDIPAKWEIIVIIALGKPKEKVVLEEIDSSANIKYWRDEQGTHHVPKRSLAEIIIKKFV